ncbi:protein lifeguard 2-like [Perognathus longimembris pacificus]|uniref:protein lifeguard 2-like n=1 Tax=Perognathus longimembris pacificus TaxID=214514 RepID=UPI002018D01E|nr:protein lifeguard 2-like [Perognathus longimembris pacificus]
MDLEVRETTDVSLGDHLAQKGEDKDTQVQSAQPYMSSHQDRTQDTRGRPYLQATKHTNVYVIHISEERNSNENNNATSPFSDASIRRAFIIKVFLIVCIQLLVTAIVISIFLFWNDLRVWVLANPWFTYAFLPAFFIILILLACCEHLRRQVPTNYILLGLFTVLQGLLLGTISVFFDVEEVLWAAGITSMVTIGLTLFALQTKWDFTLLNGVLFVFLCILMLYGIILIFIRSYWLHLLYAALGALVFSLYLVVDVQIMVGGRHHYSQLDPEEYVFAALNIYLDIVNLFLFILQLIGMGR